MERTGSKHTDNLSEAELITLAKKKNERAFLAIHDRYKDGLRVHLSKIVAQWDVEDICTQTFLKAFLHIESYDPSRSEFRTWLYTIGWNTALDHIGQKRRYMENMPTSSIDAEDRGTAVKISSHEEAPDEVISHQEEARKLRNFIEELDDLYRDIAKARFLDEVEYSEIAERFNLPINTVKTRIRRAREILMRMMDTSDELI